MRALIIRYRGGEVAPQLDVERRFTRPVRIGREPDCDLVLEGSSISRYHLAIVPEGDDWVLRDLGSANGTWRGSDSVHELPVQEHLQVQVGRQGATLDLQVAPRAYPPTSPPMEVHPAQPEEPMGGMATTPEPPPSPASGHTQMQAKVRDFVRALRRTDEALPEAVQNALNQRTRYLHQRYAFALGALALLALTLGILAWQQYGRVKRLQSATDEVFYGMKQVEMALALTSNEEEQNALRDVLRQANTTYEMLIAERGGGQRFPSQEERVVLRVLRAFGECESDAPSDFVESILKEVDAWRAPVVKGDISTSRFARALSHAQGEGYIPFILEALETRNLPPQFLYLPMQESYYNVAAVGPLSRSGYAKGMWQFIPATGATMGLKIGPQADEDVWDPLDERHDFKRSTLAAADYIATLYRGSAQASGLLVMARYNFGEREVGHFVDRLPQNPRERNFWRLIERFKLPEQTHTYVHSIVAAAVIGEDPRLFGFDFDSPTKLPSEGL